MIIWYLIRAFITDTCLLKFARSKYDVLDEFPSDALAIFNQQLYACCLINQDV